MREAQGFCPAVRLTHSVSLIFKPVVEKISVIKEDTYHSIVRSDRIAAQSFLTRHGFDASLL